MPEHSVWIVRVGSRTDGDRIHALPVRAEYFIESSHRNGIASITSKALKLAGEDGIPWAVAISLERITQLQEPSP